MARKLIIDDDPRMCKSIRRLLEHDNEYEVDEAHSGKAGLEQMRKQKADLVITDIFMPDQDGIMTIKELVKEFPGVKIIAVSGGSKLGTVNPLTMAELIGAPFTKPFKDELLLQAVKDLIG